MEKKGGPAIRTALLTFMGTHFYRTKVKPCGIKCGNTYAYIITITPTIAASATEFVVSGEAPKFV
jgi:hypothetical protein